MNARVVLLVLVTALFMTAWDGDQAAMQVAYAKRSQKQATLLAQRAAAQSTQDATAADSTDGQSSEHALTAMAYPDKQTADDAKPCGDSTCSAKAKQPGPDDVPLPTGIASGTYKAVNQAGQIVEVTVADGDVTNAGAREFYTADSKSGDRWYLIRVVR
ncbi:hypothetical protein [Fuerstiella marisgermanici]|uniref:Secreted protein n=1 Tax=Fuerstiella marisgermanici TaxID=1891926 RepID=A0A1P8WCX2_9PLAN|nr:hypothetical protein [Fuerstiella marisgermanici]APZ91903.1 hypothetical protein Fuma_01499 [Fuerstiella marisgermanici]